MPVSKKKPNKLNIKWSDRLLDWFDDHARDLPWRKSKDPYRIWLSEIMLQQTTVNTVIPYYRKWIKKYPKISSIAKANIKNLLSDWQGLGYYQRVRNIHKTAKIIQTEYRGKFPDQFDVLRKMPGFGPYTTGAVLSIAFGKPVPIIDANVRRVIMRLLGIVAGDQKSSENQIYDLLNRFIPEDNARAFNEGLMELGATICHSAQPQCHLCPIKYFCKAYDKGIQELIPPKVKKTIKNIHVVCAIIRRGQDIYIQQRPSKGLLAGLWEFPGGKIEKGETKVEALKREIFEEIGARVDKAVPYVSVKHYYTSFRVSLHAYMTHLKTKPVLDKKHRWIKLSAIKGYAFPSGDAKIISKLMEK